MRAPLRVWITAVALACPVAAALAAGAPAEIDALLDRLQRSGCQFNRNGSWYSAAEAREHLARKREYLEGRGGVGSAERFIELAATRSSSTGTPYRVRCGQEAPVESRQWMERQLGLIRQPAARSGP